MTATLEQLEQRITALEHEEQGDQLNPNVLVVNPDGTIGANLTGHLAAQGVDLPSGNVQAPPDNSRVRWQLPDGTVVADLAGWEYQPTVGDVLEMTAYARGATNRAQARMQVEGGPANLRTLSRLSVEVDPTGLGTFRIAPSGANSVVLLDGNGNSVFPQLPAAVKSAFFTKTINWPGGSSLSNTLTFAHKLGHSPTIALATISTVFQGSVIACHTVVDAANISVQAAWVNEFQAPAGYTAYVSIFAA